jgi:hypothetical protein
MVGSEWVSMESIDIAKLAGVTKGEGVWGAGDICVFYQWALTDTSSMSERHARIGALGPGVFVLVKATRTAETDSVLKFHWIQYTVALHEGQVYVPPPPAPPWPWDGVDTGARNDGSPYTETPARQARLDAGNGIGWHAVVQDLYEVEDADSIFIDWPASGGNANWGHFSVVGLIGSKGGKDRMIGAMKFAYATDADNKLVSHGGAPAEAGDIEAWKKALRAGFVNYMKNVFVDENP